MIDPTLLLLYKIALGAIIAVCGAGALLLLSRIQTPALDGSVRWLAGYKTYLISGAGTVLTACYALGYLTDAQFTMASALFTALGFGTLRAGVSKSTQAAQAATAVVTAAALPKPPVTPLRVDPSSPTPTPKDSS